MTNNKSLRIFSSLIIIFFTSLLISWAQPSEIIYNIEQVSFESSNLTLEGTLFLPNITTKTPAVVFVNGSGAGNRDGVIKGNEAAVPPVYKNWAEYLSSNGIITLRYDKRFITNKQLNPLEISQEDQISDIIAALNYLKLRGEVDAGKIFIIGHSEGGNIAPVAAKRSGFVKGVVIISSPAFAVDTLVMEQLKNSVANQVIISKVEQAFSMLRNNKFPKGGQIFGAGEQYWKQWIEYSGNMSGIISELNNSVLILQGMNDENFPRLTLEKNISLWKNISAKSPNIEFKTYENVTHLILTKDRLATALNVLDDIKDWIDIIN